MHRKELWEKGGKGMKVRVINETKTGTRDDDTKEITFPVRLILILW
jgi:hypothetical protein